MNKKNRLSKILRPLERSMRIELIAYDEESDDMPFGAEVVDRLEAQDEAGNTAPITKTAIRLTPAQVEKLTSTEERLGLHLVALDPEADQVVYGEALIERLVEEYELED